VQVRKIVVGVDFTDVSLSAARWVAAHFAPDAEILLVHVVPSVRLPSFVVGHFPPAADVAPTVSPTLYQGLNALAGLVARDRARAHVLTGDPVEALAFVAEEVGADVVCVGRGSRRRGSARFGATMPQRLLRRTRVPTLVVPAGRFDTPDRIIVAVDERAGGKDLFAAACRLAAVFEAGVDALHVIEPELEHFVALAREADNGVRESWLRDHARTWVEEMLDEAGPDGPWAAPIIRAGDAGQEIIRYVREHSTGLVVLGRGGDASNARSPGPIPLGSTARLVLWAAPFPVLVLPLDASTAMQDPSDRERDHRRTNPDLRGFPSPYGGGYGRLPAMAGHLGVGDAQRIV
jgi:nucleotide-binding universal stress UspA family protein